MSQSDKAEKICAKVLKEVLAMKIEQDNGDVHFNTTHSVLKDGSVSSFITKSDRRNLCLRQIPLQENVNVDAEDDLEKVEM